METNELTMDEWMKVCYSFKNGSIILFLQMEKLDVSICLCSSILKSEHSLTHCFILIIKWKYS